MRFRASFRRSHWAGLLFLALLMRLAVPVGWMPAWGSDGALNIILCAGNGPERALLHADGSVSKVPAEVSPLCDYALLGAALLLSLPPDMRLSAGAALSIPMRVAFASVGQGLAAPPPPATGPPIFPAI